MTIRLLANENIPLDAVEALRAAGHDVAWVREDSLNESDRNILHRAQEENRIVITFDKDFGELAFRSKLPAQSGVILFRITPTSPQYVAQVAVHAFASQNNWAGHFSVIEENRIRMTLLTRD
jgi:predicted nuclease of predicted toxin-antitoxin system